MSDDESLSLAPEEGEGKDTYPYGEYEGGRDDHLDRHGFGSALLPNNDIYEGNYAHGKRHGIGLYCFKNGARYYGEWKKGLKHGHGIFYYPDGSKYVGMWRKDLKHGHGFYYYTNGDIYEGNYYKNQRSGLGSYKYADNNVVAYGKVLQSEGILLQIYELPYNSIKCRPNTLIAFSIGRVRAECNLLCSIGPENNEMPIQMRTRDLFIVIPQDKGVWRDGQMNGSGVIRYVPFRFHGNFVRNLPKGPGCFTFDGKYILHGFYVNLRDPAFDYVSTDVLDLAGNTNAEEGKSPELPKGIVPIWRSRNITEYKEELLPPEPTDFPRPESLDSVMDIIEYLQKQYGEQQTMQVEEEMDDHRQTPSPVPTDLLIDEESAPVPSGNIDV